MREIEGACGIKFTAIVNNSNLGNVTTADDVRATLSEAEKLSDLSGLPIIFTSVDEKINVNDNNVLKLTLQEKYFDIKEN